MRLCSVSVDLDEIPNYFRIHGLADPTGPVATAVYDVAVGRLMRLARERAVPLTFFAVGADLARRSDAARALRAACAAGHEVGNHTLDHRYDLVKLPSARIAEQIERGANAIAEATGERPVGFRAPGYTVTDTVLSALLEFGVAYDSSVFPCPAYYAAKTAAIAWIALRGRESHSVMDRPQVLWAPTRPYRVGRPYWTRGAGLLELPVQVTPGARLPFIGTTLTLAGPRIARLLARSCVGEPFVNLELHGIDVLDARDGLDALCAHQVDVRVARERKLDALYATLEVFAQADYTFVTLREAAEQLRPTLA